MSSRYDRAMTASRTNDPEGVRRRILDAAFEAFTQQGYNATGMQALRRKAGVSGGAFAHHFPTKKALCLAVIEERVAMAIEQAWIIPVQAAPHALAGIRQVFEHTIAGIEARGTVSGCPLGNLAAELAGQDQDFRRAMDAIYQHWQQAIAARLAGQKRAKLSPRQCEALAQFVIAVFSGALVMAKARQDATPLRDGIGKLLQMQQF